MELLVSAKLAHSKFHGIPWNCLCQRNGRTPSSMEFHGTACVGEIGPIDVPRNFISKNGALHVPWNSMELLVSAKLAQSNFHEILWNSMELLVSVKLAQSKFHGIPWNCSCQRRWHIPSSMEFHGTAHASEIGAISVSRNSMESFFGGLMEPFVSSILWVLNLDRTPWNLSFHILMKIIFNSAGWINFRKSISTLYIFVSLFQQLMFYYQYLHYTICISGITQNEFKSHSKSLFNAN